MTSSSVYLLSDCGSQRVDTTARAVLDIMTKTTEYLQPNPGDTFHLRLYVFVYLQ